jgi:1-acylglycerone phosphate reductase
MASRKHVLITGCAYGSLGYYLAKEFVQHGLHVFATARRLESMKALASMNNITLLTLDSTTGSLFVVSLRK